MSSPPQATNNNANNNHNKGDQSTTTTTTTTTSSTTPPKQATTTLNPNAINTATNTNDQQLRQQDQQAATSRQQSDRTKNDKTTQQQQQGYPEVAQHQLVNRLIREISVKIHHASSGKMTAAEVSAAEAASKRANRKLREKYGMPSGTSLTMTSGQRATATLQSGEGGGRSSRRGRRTGNRTDAHGQSGNFGMDDEDRSPSAGARSKQSNVSHGKKSSDDENTTNTGSSGKKKKKPNNNGGGGENRIVFAKSVFDKLPRASDIPEGFFKKHQLLGSGAFAQTFLCEWVSEIEDRENEVKAQQQQSSRGSSVGSNKSLQKTSSAKKIQISPRQASLRGGGTSGSSRAGAGGGSGAASGGAGGKFPKVYTNTSRSRSPRASQSNNITRHHHDKNNNNNTNSQMNTNTTDNNVFGATNENQNTTATSPAPAEEEECYTAAQLASPYGQVSHLSSTKPSVTSGVDGSHIPRDRAFVCKFEPADTATKRLECMGNPNATNISEEHILANCAHPNIVAFVDRFQDSENNNVLVMEYVDGGDLKHELDRRGEKVVASTGEAVSAKHFSERSILFLFVQMTMAIEYLHRHNILHRDLKTPNILLSKKWLVKISDFGLAKQFDTDVDLNVSVSNVGTPYYLPAELFRRKPYSEKADIWCLGIILYELITLKKPFDGDTIKDLARAVCLEPPVPFNRSTISDDLKNVCLKMLSKSPADRPSAKELLRHPLMEGAMQDFLDKFAIATSSSTSSVDVSWNRVLHEQRKLIHKDTLSSTKSRRSQSRERSSNRHSAYASSLHSRSGESRRYDDDSDAEDDDTATSDAGTEHDENVGVNAN